MGTFDQELQERNLPQLLKSESGRAVSTVQDWQLRREEILHLLYNQYMGKAPEDVQGQYRILETDEDAYGGKALRRKVEVMLSRGEHYHCFPFQLVIPKAQPRKKSEAKAAGTARTEKKDPFPVFLHLQFNDQIAGGLGEELVDNGYAIAHVCYNDMEPDNSRESYTGLAGFDPVSCPQRWGKIAVWALGASKILDYLLTEPLLDPDRIAVAGHSRLGLTALWCGAVDQRFSLAAGMNSGSLYRGSAAETFLDLSREYTRYWFCPALFRDGRDINEVPFDMHFLLALIAPRHVYLTGASRDRWTDAHSQVLAAAAASEVFELYGVRGFVTGQAALEYDKPFQQGHIGFYLRNGTHYLGRDDWHAVMDYRKKHQI